ncbi:Os01g0245565 [Oryza sativa Japonica Group]|uniref:Os01g0245565 protein n=1 Tax=Oryza sativa subsp. japonica TaxID=39947 RepID=A0A0N7KCN4_ORYSJ|nr:Os01g0245565 [Oryza sativa Japonica Group]
MRYVQIHGPPDEQVVTIWTLHDRVHARWRREYEVPFVETWDGKRYKRSEMERKVPALAGALAPQRPRRDLLLPGPTDVGRRGGRFWSTSSSG